MPVGEFFGRVEYMGSSPCRIGRVAYSPFLRSLRSYRQGRTQKNIILSGEILLALKIEVGAPEDIEGDR